MEQYEKKAARSSLQDNGKFQKIASWLMTVKFRKRMIGGLDAADVWKKIEELNAMYEKALIAERARCNLLAEQLAAEKSEKASMAGEAEPDA